MFYTGSPIDPNVVHAARQILDRQAAKRCMGVRVDMEEGNPFVYEVSLDGYLAAPSDSGQDEVRSRYYRAEVYLHNGNQEYDLMGFTDEQICRDVLDQFESHRQLLGRVYS